MIVSCGLSSMNSGASARRPMAWLIFGQSASARRPLRMRALSTRASEAMRPGREVEVAHLQAEEQHRAPGLQGGVGGHPEGEGGLAHRRAGADHDEVRRLQARTAPRRGRRSRWPGR
jgi:hypothetical protein